MGLPIVQCPSVIQYSGPLSKTPQDIKSMKCNPYMGVGQLLGGGG
jgi:hypothetical protein